MPFCSVLTLTDPFASGLAFLTCESEELSQLSLSLDDCVPILQWFRIAIQDYVSRVSSDSFLTDTSLKRRGTDRVLNP